jgi:hypothetical protein
VACGGCCASRFARIKEQVKDIKREPRAPGLAAAGSVNFLAFAFVCSLQPITTLCSLHDRVIAAPTINIRAMVVHSGRGDHGWRFANSTARSSELSPVPRRSHHSGQEVVIERVVEKANVDCLPHPHVHELLRVGSGNAC